MNLEVALFTFLKGTAGVASLVTDATSPLMYRIYPDKIPQGAASPAIRYSNVSNVNPQGLDGPSAYQTSRFQIDAWAITKAAVNTLAAALVTALNGHRGAFGGVNIQHAYIEDTGALPEFDPEEQDYRITLDLIILASD